MSASSEAGERIDMIKGVLFDLGDTLIEQRADDEEPLSALDLVAFPDVQPVLAELKARGYLIGLVSNTFQSNSSDVTRALERLGLIQCFDSITTSVDVAAKKPLPRIFLAALDRLGIAANEAIMIGDNPEEDIAGASRLGMATILIARDQEGATRNLDAAPDFTVESLQEILPILSRRGKDPLTPNLDPSPKDAALADQVGLAEAAEGQFDWIKASQLHIAIAERRLADGNPLGASSHYMRAARCRERSEDWRDIGDLWVNAAQALEESEQGSCGSSRGKPYTGPDASKHFFSGIDPEVWEKLPREERIGRAYRYAGYHLEEGGTNQSAYNQYFRAGTLFESAGDWEQASRAYYLGIISFIQASGELNHEQFERMKEALTKCQSQEEERCVRQENRHQYRRRARLYYRRIAGELRSKGNEEDVDMLLVRHREITRHLAFKDRKILQWSLYSLWKVTSSYGTSFGRWLLLTVLLAFGLFPALYSLLDLLTPQPHTWWDSLYFSTAAFVTLSYFDFAPVGLGRLVALSETVVGLFMLGSLLTMIVNKLTR